MGRLYIVSTPIGNLGDITYRAIEILREADVILAEDTRRTAVLLNHYHISGRLVSAHEHNEASRAATVVDMLREGKEVALVSDAGTPLLSDPGSRIVREVVAAGFPVVPVPGASALLAALVTSGIAADRFTFLAFLPRKGRARSDLLEEIARSPYASVMYESPNRVAELLRDLADSAGGTRAVAVARELTKLYEEVFRGTLAEAVARYEKADPRGEIVVVVAGRPDGAQEEAETDELAALSLAQALLLQGNSPSAVAKELQRRLRIPRNSAYQIAQTAADATDEADEGSSGT